NLGHRIEATESRLRHRDHGIDATESSLQNCIDSVGSGRSTVLKVEKPRLLGSRDFLFSDSIVHRSVGAVYTSTAPRLQAPVSGRAWPLKSVKTPAQRSPPLVTVDPLGT